MPIAKKPQKDIKPQQDDAAAEAFINAADAPPKPTRRRKERVMIQFDPRVLERVDEAAEHRGISRSSWIQYVVGRALDAGEG